MRIALVPGSFDPITKGHVNIIERASTMFDTVYVTIFINAQKTPRFEITDRINMIKAACAHINNVIVDSNDGMLADYCKKKRIGAVVKGARNSVDFEYETKMAHFNRDRNPELDTVILCAEKGLEDISSTALYELIKSGGDYEKYVPENSLVMLKHLIVNI